jgi:hypothetical protein
MGREDKGEGVRRIVDTSIRENYGTGDRDRGRKMK